MFGFRKKNTNSMLIASPEALRMLSHTRHVLPPLVIGSLLSFWSLWTELGH